MADSTWEIVGDLAIFKTKSLGDIVLPLSSYNQFYDQIRDINWDDEYYHEYSHDFNTGIRDDQVPLSVMQDILKQYPTPFTDQFAGVGIVYGLSGVNGAIMIRE